MATPLTPREELESVVAAYVQCGHDKTATAKLLKRPRTTIRERLRIAERSGIVIPPKPAPEPLLPKGRRLEADITDGVVLIASDAHYWPGPPSTAHRAFVRFCKRMKPSIVVMNGDALDCSSISRFPPIGWTHIPSVKDELEVSAERLGEIVKASGKAKRYWPAGNHDLRFETKIASSLSELKGVPGTSLNDHYADWEPCWTLFIGSQVVVTHRFKGGIHSTHNSTLWAGRSMVCGHLHSLKVTPFSDYNGTRFGVDCGCLADVYSPAFQDYLEDNPRNWRSGFVVLTFKNGRLLWPEVCHVLADGLVEFRGELIEV